MPAPRTGSFRARLLRQQVLILALAIVSATAMYSMSQRFLLRSHLETHGSALARALAVGLRDFDTVNEQLPALESEADIAYVVVYDATGTLVASWQSWASPGAVPTDSIRRSTVESMQPGEVQVRPRQGPLIREFMSPIIVDGRTRGVVRVGLATSAIQRARRNFVFVSLLASLSVLVGAVIAANLMVRRFADPLAKLAATARAFGEGDLEARLDEDETGRDDEIGEVAASFNRMAEDLNRVLRRLEDTLGERTAELARHKPRLESVLDSVNDGVAMMDPTGVYVLTNRRFREMFGLRELKVVGLHYSELFDHLKNALPEMNRLLERADHFQTHADERALDTFELTIPARRMIQRFSAPIRQDEVTDSRILGRIEVYRDITREVEVDRMKNEFISTVSHELRTPLTSIKGSLGLMLGGATGELSEEGREMVAIAQANSERLIRLINDILDISKIESGRMRFEMRTVDLPALVAQTARSLESFAARSDAALDLEIPEGEHPVVADPDRIAQVLTNLLSNAIKFSPPGGTVHVRLRVKDRFYRIQVRDEGPGIKPDDVPRLFQKFSQLSATISEQKGGTGLGLAICRALVEEHGGDIWVRSAPGEGSTFAFTLPRPRDAQPAQSESTAAAVVILAPPEHAPDLQPFLEAGFRALSTHDPDDVIATAHGESGCVVLLDPRTPGVWSLLRALKDDPRTRDVPTFVGAVMGSSVSLGLQTADWVSRPVELERLAESARVATTERVGPRPLALVVDDDPEEIPALVRALEDAGFETDTAADGHQALASIQARVPDVVVLDIAMPGQDAFATMQNMRTSRGGKRASAIWLTDARLEADDEGILKRGFLEDLRRDTASETAAIEELVDAVDTALEIREKMTADSLGLPQDLIDAATAGKREGV